MAGNNSIYRTVFHLELAPGRPTSGPYTCSVGIAAGTGGDIQTTSVATSLTATVTANLLGILQSFDSTATKPNAIPGGLVVIDSFTHASDPDCWI